MAWIESHTVLMRHRKLAELARGLRVRRAHALGHLHALWHAVLEQQDDGDLSAWSDEFIAEMSDFSGGAPQYVRLLQSTGFLGYRDAASGELVAGSERLVHDWPDYAGRFLMNKYATSNREWLVRTWGKHGRTYGRKNESGDVATDKQLNSNYTLPTKPTQPTHPPKAAVDGAKVAAEERRRKTAESLLFKGTK